MNQINVGRQIRRLRLAAGMTQERLAERLGVAPQTVSKWENELTAPDLSLLAPLADLFRVSMDELLGYDGKARREEIEKLSLLAWEKRKAGDLKGASAILEEGLARFPGDEILLNCALYSMEDREERIRAAKALSESTDMEVRYDAFQFLAKDYGALGRYDLAREALEGIPEIYFTKLGVAAEVLPGEEKRDFAVRQKWISLGDLVDMMAELIRYYKGVGQDDQAAAERDKAERLIGLFAPDIDWADELRESLNKAE